MKFSLVSPGPDVTRLECEGEITQSDLTPGKNIFTTLLGPDCFSCKVLFNMSKVTFMDSAAVGWLVMSHKSFKDAGGMLVLHSIPPFVDHVFQLLKMPKILNLAKDEKAALALATGGGS
jgi:anti-anti-sigma factor